MVVRRRKWTSVKGFSMAVMKIMAMMTLTTSETLLVMKMRFPKVIFPKEEH